LPAGAGNIGERADGDCRTGTLEAGESTDRALIERELTTIVAGLLSELGSVPGRQIGSMGLRTSCRTRSLQTPRRFWRRPGIGGAGAYGSAHHLVVDLDRQSALSGRPSQAFSFRRSRASAG
jgi:hypothetical protein